MDGNIEKNNDEDAVLDITPVRIIRECCCHRKGNVSTSDITTIEISCDQRDDKYFIGEDVTILASFGNPSAVIRFEWVKKTGSRYHPIDTTLQKYIGSTCSDEVEKPMLIIKDCNKLDIGTYFVRAHCNHALPIDSHEIDLKVVEGPPRVTLNTVPLALENEIVEIKATIRGFPKFQSVIWMKDDQCIDTTDPKYEGSVENCEFPVLRIKEVKERDSGVYKVIARNELGEGESSEDLEVIGKSQMLFISGPVVVAPSETITFQAYLPRRGNMSAKWWKINDKSKEELKDDKQKYHINYQTNDKICFEIFWADKEDSGAYQLSFGKMRSNKINVRVDDSGTFSTSKQGNRLRLFELQSVSADAMRIVFDNMPRSFANKIQKYCKSLRNSKKKNELLSDLQTGTKSSSKDLDITLMYSIIRNLWKRAIPQNGWGKDPMGNHIEPADDIERIRHYRNLVCHCNDKGIDTNVFNFSCLDLSKAIGRLSSNDPTLIKTSCEIMNRVSTKGEYLHEMIEKIKKEKKLDETFSNEENSYQSSSVNENMDDEPRPRASPSSSNKDPPSPPSSPQDDARDDGPMHRASPSSSNKYPPSPPSFPQDDARDDGPMNRASPSSSNKDPPSPSSSPQDDARDDGPMHRASPSSSNKDPPSPPSSPQDDARDGGPMHRASPSSSNKDLFSSPSLYLHEDRDKAPIHRTSPSMTTQEIYVRAQRTDADRGFSDCSVSETHDMAQRTEGPLSYADRGFSTNADSETYNIAQSKERPMSYAGRRFSYNADSENHYRSQRTERPMRYSNRRLSNNTDSESLYYTRIPTRSGKIEHIRFHEVCDPEIIMDETYTTAKQTKPYGDGMFFMNRPLKLEEKIHIYGCTYSNASFRESRPTMKIGLISIDPGEIREAVQQKKYYVRGLEEIKCFSDDDQKTDFFHMYICLCPNATLSICVKGLQEHFYENQEISSFNAIWLVIEPYGIDKIKILPN